MTLPAVDDPQILAFWEYWSGLPKLGLAPRLADYLDRAPPALQPSVVIIDVYTPERFEVRLVGTALVNLIGKDITGSDVLSLYAKEARRDACRLAWCAVQQTCGYLCDRLVTSAAGLSIETPSIALPVVTKQTACGTIVNFTSLARAEARLSRGDMLQVVQGLKLLSWIDLGNGIPK